MEKQLFLFEDSPIEKVQREIKLLHDKYDRMRKAQFAEIGVLKKKYDETKHDYETLKAAVCRYQTITQTTLL
jgi:hypothetical protein